MQNFPEIFLIYFQLNEKTGEDSEKLLNHPFIQGLIPRPEDPDFDAFCGYIGLNKSSDTHS